MVIRPHTSNPLEDDEQTVELPTLPGGASPVDAGAPPRPGAGAAARSADTLRRADLSRERRSEPGLREAEIATLRSDLVSATERRRQLERNLADLSTKLRELEQQLDRRSARLAASEREVQLRDGRIEALEARLRALGDEHAAATAQHDTLRAELGLAREEALTDRGRLQSQERRRLQGLEADAAEARAQAEHYRELLHNHESRRAVFTTMLAERDEALGEREARILELTRELAERTKLTGAREEDLQVLLRAEQQRVRERDEAFAALRDSLQQREALVERLQAEAAGRAAATGERREILEATGTHEPTHMLVHSEEESGIVQRLGRCNTIGRTTDNDIRIDTEFISRHHAVILMSGTMTVLEDLNSTNGTFVNGERISRCTLRAGDRVTIGKSEFRYMVKPPTEHPG